jgi:hypothetical protein
VMLNEPRAVEAQPIGELDLFDRFVELPLLVTVVPGPGHFVFEEQPEPHRGTLIAAREGMIGMGAQ